MKEIITSCILFIIAIGAFIKSYRSFKEKGFLFNNAYIYAIVSSITIERRKTD